MTKNKLTVSGYNAKVTFDGNWFAFLENLFQIPLFQLDTYNFYVPKFVQKVVIDPLRQQKLAENSSNGKHSVEHELNKTLNFHYYFFLIFIRL